LKNDQALKDFAPLNFREEVKDLPSTVAPSKATRWLTIAKAIVNWISQMIAD
jgi:hypothetical protein